MAFSIRKMLSNMNYFKKPDEDGDGHDSSGKKRRHSSTKSGESISVFDKIEPDSTSKTCATASITPPANCPKTGSHSDTDLLANVVKTRNVRRRNKKLKLDIQKANKSMSEALDAVSDQENINVENTPKHLSLGCKSSEAFSERIKDFDFSKSFDIFDAMSEDLPDYKDHLEIESLSERSDSEISLNTSDEKTEVQMCRKVEVYGSHLSVNDLAIRSTTPESFGDVEIDKTEDDRITLLLSYQMRLEKMEQFLKKLLTEFQFHIEVSKVFHCKSVVTTLPGSDVSKLPKILGEITHIDNISRGPSPTGSWNIIIEKEDTLTKFKLRKQLLSMKHFIEEFITSNLQNEPAQIQDSTPEVVTKTRKFFEQRSITFDLHKGRRVQRRLKVSHKKKYKRCNDFPDLEDALHNLFSLDTEKEDLDSTINSVQSDECTCRCQRHNSPDSQTDSGLIIKTEDRSMSITSSIGNFSLDNSTLTAYSDTLDQVISYNSFEDSSLYNTLLQKAAIERISFYVQVHSIQIKCDSDPTDLESKSQVNFFCPSCKHSEIEEQGLVKHILEQTHCEKMHFLYKTAYIKKCLSAGKEIQPSTVLNPMTMYRDDNKIVCFGDAAYACSLCFESMIVGESVLMAHCADPDHVDRRERLADILE